MYLSDVEEYSIINTNKKKTKADVAKLYKISFFSLLFFSADTRNNKITTCYTLLFLCKL